MCASRRPSYGRCVVTSMARYLVERTFEAPPSFPVAAIVERNADAGVTWLCSYVSDDGRTVFCLYDAPSPEAIRRAAARNGLPVHRIHEVSVLDPYPYAKTP
jgi:hypothetical protein